MAPKVFKMSLKHNKPYLMGPRWHMALLQDHFYLFSTGAKLPEKSLQMPPHQRHHSAITLCPAVQGLHGLVLRLVLRLVPKSVPQHY